MDLEEYKKLKQETKETVHAFEESSLAELRQWGQEAMKMEDAFIAQLEALKTKELLRKINDIGTSE